MLIKPPIRDKKRFFIYGLVDPIGLKVRYVGVTENIERRLKQHLGQRGRNYDLIRWIQSLNRQGMVPQVQILEEVESWFREDAFRAETCWIAKLQPDFNIRQHSLVPSNRYKQLPYKRYDGGPLEEWEAAVSSKETV